MKDNFVSETIKTLLAGVAYSYGMDVEGDIAEFGTMTGRTAVGLAVAQKFMTQKYKNIVRKNKKVWFFDSFEGLPEASSKIDLDSPHVKKGDWGPGTCKGLSELEFNNLISSVLDKDQFETVAGWYKDTINNVSKEKFSMVHIDCDLYESSIQVLDGLFSNGQICEGAIIFFDDWNCNYASNQYGERKAWEETVNKFELDYSDEGSYSMASRKFIVHDYTGMVKRED